MTTNPLYSRCIRRAAELLGGYENLAHHIDVSARHLQVWAQGRGAPSKAVFLRIIDVVLDDRSRK